MRFDRQLVAGVFATAIAFFFFPLLFGNFTLIAFGGQLLTNAIVWLIAYLFAQISFRGGGKK